MSLIQSARPSGHNPYAYAYAYLKDVLTRLPTQRASEIEQLLPLGGCLPKLHKVSWADAYTNRLHRTFQRALRYDWLGHCLFESIAEVQEHTTRQT